MVVVLGVCMVWLVRSELAWVYTGVGVGCMHGELRSGGGRMAQQWTHFLWV